MQGRAVKHFKSGVRRPTSTMLMLSICLMQLAREPETKDSSMKHSSKIAIRQFLWLWNQKLQSIMLDNSAMDEFTIWRDGQQNDSTRHPPRPIVPSLQLMPAYQVRKSWVRQRYKFFFWRHFSVAVGHWIGCTAITCKAKVPASGASLLVLCVQQRSLV